MIYQRVSLGILLVTSMSCYRTIVLEPDSLEANPFFDIRVTKDSLQYDFSWGDYLVVTDSLGNRYIHGRGLVHQEDTVLVGSFEGDIGFNEIERITALESTVRDYLPIYVMVFAVGIVVIFYGKIFRLFD